MGRNIFRELSHPRRQRDTFKESAPSSTKQGREISTFALLTTMRAFKEARKGFFGCYSVCETMKDTKEG